MLSIVIPAYNERRTIARAIAEVSAALPDVQKEIVIVDDGSSDGTGAGMAGNLAKATGLYAAIEVSSDGELVLTPSTDTTPATRLRAIHHPVNRGKGRRSGPGSPPRPGRSSSSRTPIWNKTPRIGARCTT